jgi:nucleotide-binding universal stress UspA family protein
VSAPIVVGYDGSRSSQQALDWAATEATARDRALQVVHVVADTTVAPSAFVAPGYGLGADMYPATDPDVFVKIGNEKLQAAVQHVRNTAPDLQIDTQVLIGQPEGALLDHLEELEDGVVVVVGNRGDSGLSELLIGSTAAKLATHAPCPVVVVRPAPEGLQASEEAGRVVVGVDGSPVSTAAVEFAFEEASIRRLGLSAVHAWTPAFRDLPPGQSGELMKSMVVADFEGDELRLVGESMAGWRERYPEVDVRQILFNGEPTEGLVAASAGAALLVVGTRGRGGFKSRLLGSVSRDLLHQAACPVAVVRPPAD